VALSDGLAPMAFLMAQNHLGLRLGHNLIYLKNDYLKRAALQPPRVLSKKGTCSLNDRGGIRIQKLPKKLLKKGVHKVTLV
jgi:hypothetical protein